MKIGIDGVPLSEVRTGVGHYTFEITHHMARLYPLDKFELVSHLPFHPSVSSDLDKQTNLTLNPTEVNSLTRHWWTIGLPLYIKCHSLEVFHGTNYEVPVWGGCPTVLTIHDLSLLLFPQTHEARRVRRARLRLPFMSRIASLIIAPTQSIKNDICNYLHVPADKVVVVPEAPRRCFLPVPVGEAIRICKRLGVEDDFLLYVGTIEPRKNLMTLIRAFEDLLRTTSFRPQLVIAGRKGWLTEDLFKYIKCAALGDRLLITGYVSDSELRALYSACRITIYPALYEGAGLPPLEAMACGAPVITTNDPAISEMVGDNARLVSPTDYESLAHNIADLLSDRGARHELGSAGLRRAAEFTWENAARLTRDVYDEATSRHARTRE
jgi:glycosyltransferase involved in cell wall biosynthesis